MQWMKTQKGKLLNLANIIVIGDGSEAIEAHETGSDPAKYVVFTGNSEERACIMALLEAAMWQKTALIDVPQIIADLAGKAKS